MTPPTPAQRNAAEMLRDFRALMKAHGYGRLRDDHEAQRVAAILADARLHCRQRRISWETVCELATEQFACDLGELRHMTDQEIDLRKLSRTWGDGR